MKKIPDHVLHNTKTYTAREFKAQKRKQVREVLRALDELRTGCAYLPGGPREVDIATRALR